MGISIAGFDVSLLSVVNGSIAANFPRNDRKSLPVINIVIFRSVWFSAYYIVILSHECGKTENKTELHTYIQSQIWNTYRLGFEQSESGSMHPRWAAYIVTVLLILAYNIIIVHVSASRIVKSNCLRYHTWYLLVRFFPEHFHTRTQARTLAILCVRLKVVTKVFWVLFAARSQKRKFDVEQKTNTNFTNVTTIGEKTPICIQTQVCTASIGFVISFRMELAFCYTFHFAITPKHVSYR